MKEIRFILIVLILGILSSGCTKEDALPDLPPQKSMVMEFDNLWQTSPLPEAQSEASPPSNFIFAASTIYWWNTVLTIQMAIPVAVYIESFNHEPVWDKSSLSWVWSYTINLQKGEFTAELFGKTEADEVQWSMYISKTDDYTDFLWFTGVSALDNKSGSWIINKDPNSDVKGDDESLPFIEVQWAVDENGDAGITYTGIEEGSVNEGSYIEFGKTDDPDLDAYYDIYKAWEENLINIKWNTEFHFGRVRSMADFQEPYWNCWDELLKNIVCD